MTTLPDLEPALEPFTTFARESVERTDSGWQWSSGLGRDRICDWFGPSDFGLLAHFAEALAARSTAPEAGKAVTLRQLQTAHIERQAEWCPDQVPDLSFRGNEMAGEVGEACNVIKKLERERHGWRGSRATKEQLAEELGDVIHTAILCAITAGIDIEPATVAKFNSTSEKNGLSTFIPALASVAPSGAEPVATPFGLNEESIDALRSNGLKPEEIAVDPVKQAQRVRELLHWFVRLSRGSANPKWTRDHAFELAYYIATTDDRAPIDTYQIEKDAWLKGVKATHAERDQMLRLGFITQAEFDAAKAPQAVPAEDVANLIAATEAELAAGSASAMDWNTRSIALVRRLLAALARVTEERNAYIKACDDYERDLKHSEAEATSLRRKLEEACEDITRGIDEEQRLQSRILRETERAEAAERKLEEAKKALEAARDGFIRVKRGASDRSERVAWRAENAILEAEVGADTISRTLSGASE